MFYLWAVLDLMIPAPQLSLHVNRGHLTPLTGGSARIVRRQKTKRIVESKALRALYELVGLGLLAWLPMASRLGNHCANPGPLKSIKVNGLCRRRGEKERGRTKEAETRLMRHKSRN